MELRHLRYFVALAEQRNFTHAARVVHVTQSTLSHQIRQLEEELGHELFDRSGREVTLTNAGEALLPGVRRALFELNSAIRNLKGSGGAVNAQLRVLAGARVFCRRILPAALSDYHCEQQTVRVSVDETMASLLPQQLLAADPPYDLVIGDAQHATPQLEFEPLYQEDVGLLVPRGHRFARRRRVRIIELHGEELALPSRCEPSRVIIDRCLSAVGSQPVVVTEINMVEAVFDLARQNSIAAITAFNMRPISDDMVYVALEDPLPERTVGFLWQHTRPVPAHVRILAESIRRTVHRLSNTAGGEISVRACTEWVDRYSVSSPSAEARTMDAVDGMNGK